MNRTLLGFARIGLLAGGALVLPALSATAATGAAIYIAGEATGNMTVWNESGALLDGGATTYNVSDGFAVGDVDGDGADEVIVAGDVSGDVDIYRAGMDAAPMITFPANFTISDGLAVGDIDGDGFDEILIAGDVSGDVEIYSRWGALVATHAIAYSIADGFAVGDLDGDGDDEILVAGDASGDVDVFAGDGTLIRTFDGDFSISDGFATGDLDGDGDDEILIAGDASGDIDVFAGDGTLIRTFDGNFSISDGFAAGDVDGDGKDEILVAGDVSSDVDIFRGDGTLVRTLDLDFTIADGFAVGRNAFPDRDGDGLLDQWEMFGYDADGDGTIDVNFPAMQADPDHKDLYLEFDWVAGQQPTQRAIRAVKAAFAQAPIDAGGTVNPDGQPGITLHVDTGSLADPAAMEVPPPGPAPGTCNDGLDNDNDGAADAGDNSCRENASPGSCSDGIDNDGDGRTDDNDGTCTEARGSCTDGLDNDGDGVSDGSDTDCLVGDNFGGGNQIANNVDCIDTLYYAAKSTNFASARRRVFRYGISASSSGNSCGGGRGEIGGNDFVEFNHDGGTIMHEFGHNLGLHHGGTDDSNCKPNFVSVMNYDNQFGINRTAGGQILDYAPARRADGSRGGVLPTIEENHLDEQLIMDASDSTLMMVYTDGTGAKRQARLDQFVDWDGDLNAGGASDATVNIDDDGSGGRPAACDNSSDSSTLDSHDDWSVVALNFRGFGDYDDGALNPVTEPEQTLTDMLEHQQLLNTTDLAVTVTDSVDPATAGLPLQYQITVTNAGSNPTQASQVRATLPAGVTHVSTPNCFFGGGEVTCDMGILFPGQSRTFTTTVNVAADLVHVAGAPVTIAMTAVVRNVDGGDPVAANDTATQQTLVKAVADLSVTSVGTAGVPAEMLIGQPATLTMTETLTSFGPSSPMDARVTRTVVPAAGSSATLAEPVAMVPALVAGAVRETSSDVTIACALPGPHGFSLTSSVSPARPDDTDPVAGNDTADAAFGVECVVPVSIRVRPAMNGKRNGVVPVEIMTTAAGENGLPLAFDATTINAASVRFGSHDAAWSETGGAFEDHDRAHGGDDAVMHFRMAESGLDGSEGEACVKGTFTTPGGETFKFFGCDTLRWAGR